MGGGGGQKKSLHSEKFFLAPRPKFNPVFAPAIHVHWITVGNYEPGCSRYNRGYAWNQTEEKTAFGVLGFYSETNLGPYVRDLDQSKFQ